MPIPGGDDVSPQIGQGKEFYSYSGREKSFEFFEKLEKQIWQDVKLVLQLLV